jgi:hypothetical protein
MVESQELVDRHPELSQLFDIDSERRQLQKQLTNQLLAYFDAVYEVLSYSHPSCKLPIVVWMTKDEEKNDNPFQGPIPLLFRLPPDFVQYDYREGNDDRGGVIRRVGNQLAGLNPTIEEVLKLPENELREIIEGIGSRMEEIGDERKRQTVVEKLREWERTTGHDKDLTVEKTQRHDYNLALKDLHEYYTRALSQFPRGH